MNAQGQPHFQVPFPGQPQMQASQQGTGQPRNGPGQQSSSNTPQQKGNQPKPFDPRLSQWTLKRSKKTGQGKSPSWDDVEPRQQHVSYDSLLQELESMQETLRKEKSTVQKLLNTISDGAHAKVSELVQEQNKELARFNPQLQWLIVSMRLAWSVTQHTFGPNSRYLKRIDVILKTEPKGLVPGTGSKGGASGNSQDVSGKASGMQGQGPNQAHGQGQNVKMNQNPNFGNMPDPQFNQQPSRGPGPQGGPPGPPPPPPPPPNMGPQGMPGPPPPPPVHGGPQKQQQPNFQQQGMPNPASFPEPPPFPSMRYEPPHFPGPEMINPHILKKQKSKSKMHPGAFPDESNSDSNSESDSDSDSDSTGSDYQSGFTPSEPDYDMITGRPRKSSHKKHSSRSRSRRRDSVHVDSFRGQKQKPSHRNFNPGPPPIGKFSGHKPNQTSPRSSKASIESPVVQVHVHNGPAPSNERERDWGRDRERENNRERRKVRDRPERERDQRHPSYDVSPGSSPRSSFSKMSKFPTSQPMERNSSTSTSRDSYTSCDDDVSSVSNGDGSTFSVPMQPTIPRGNNRHTRERLDQPYHNDVRRSGQDHMHDDYPYQHQSRPHRHHRRSYIPTLDMTHDMESSYYDDEPSAVNVVQRPNLMRRNSTQVYQYSREHRRHQPTRSISYNEPIPDNYFPPQKALPDPQTHYLEEGLETIPDIQSVVEATVEALDRKKAMATMAAMEHIQQSQQSRRPLRTGSNAATGRGSMYPWASGMPEYSPSNPMSGYGRKGAVYGNSWRHVDV